jgi:hypothetical protein
MGMEQVNMRLRFLSLAYLSDIAAKNAGRITFSDLDPRRLAWMNGDDIRIRRDIEDLVQAGLLIEALGPRGGKGWRLTPAGEAQAAKERARIKRKYWNSGCANQNL